jgi:hypothetical protein
MNWFPWILGAGAIYFLAGQGGKKKGGNPDLAFDVIEFSEGVPVITPRRSGFMLAAKGYHYGRGPYVLVMGDDVWSRPATRAEFEQALQEAVDTLSRIRMPLEEWAASQGHVETIGDFVLGPVTDYSAFFTVPEDMSLVEAIQTATTIWSAEAPTYSEVEATATA